MLFADKVILVEGIAERLLLPLFMEKCGCAFEDGHISIVEIGGKHFDYFIELFNDNAVEKKVLCVTDKDFNWFENNDAGNEYKRYKTFEAPHIKKLNETFAAMPNLKIVSQSLGGVTLEDELLLANFENNDTVMSLLGISVSKTIIKFISENGIDFSEWKDVVLCKAKKSIETAKSNVDSAIAADTDNTSFYKRLFISILFLAYAENKKGDIALNILTDDKLATEIVVPPYIKEGLEWKKVIVSVEPSRFDKTQLSAVYTTPQRNLSGCIMWLAVAPKKICIFIYLQDLTNRLYRIVVMR
jgi:hypothetical protein